MTPTTTPIVATNCVIMLDDAAGSPVNISGQSNAVEIKPENKNAEYRVFGSPWQQRKAGVGKDVTVTIKAVLTTTAAEVRALIEGWYFGGQDEARTLTVYMPDNNTGSGVYTMETVLNSYNIPLDAEADDVVRSTIELASHAVVGHGTVGS